MSAPRILVADDENSVRAVLESLLQKDGYDVIPAVNGKEAVELAKTKDPDVIIIDLRMPVMGGIEACNRIREDEKTKNTPILVITAAADCKEEAIKSGVDDFISKPFDAQEVSIRVKAMLRIKNLTNRLWRVVAYINELQGQAGKSMVRGW